MAEWSYGGVGKGTAMGLTNAQEELQVRYVRDENDGRLPLGMPLRTKSAPDYVGSMPKTSKSVPRKRRFGSLS